MKQETRSIGIQTKKPVDTVIFDSVHEIKGFITKRGESGFSRQCYRYDDDKFCSYSWDETLNALMSGWPEGVGRIEYGAALLDRRLEDNTGTTIQYDTEGDYIDIGRYLDGEPECWGYMTPVEGKRRTIDVIVNIGAPSGVPERYFINRGAALSSLINQLIKDYFVNLYIVSYNIGSVEGRHNLVIFNLDTTNMYSRDLIAFCVAHPGMLRRVAFAAREAIYDKDDLNDQGYGESHDFIPRDIGIETTDYLYFGKMSRDDYQWGSFDGAERQVRAYLQTVKERVK